MHLLYFFLYFHSKAIMSTKLGLEIDTQLRIELNSRPASSDEVDTSWRAKFATKGLI